MEEKSCRSNKEEFSGSIVYFFMVISSKVEHWEIIECTADECDCIHGTRLQI
jgi:hypothetical protein